jgi:hypothetical protein
MADEENPTDGAQAQMQMLEALIEDGMGVSFRGGMRDDDKSNEEVIEYLAGLDGNGNPNPNFDDAKTRDIRPDSDQEREAATRYMETVDRRLETVGKTRKGKDVDPEKQANAAGVAALRAAGTAVAEAMLYNLVNRITTSGPNAGGNAPFVSEA